MQAHQGCDESEAKDKDEKDEKGKKNLLGKVNNLITSDLDNITQARDFLFLCESILHYDGWFADLSYA